MFRRIPSLLMLFLIFSACRTDTKEEKIQPLRFENQSFVEKAGENCDTADYDCAVIALDVVRAKGNSEVSEKINQTLDRHLIGQIIAEEPYKIQDLEQLSESFLNDYREAARNFSEEPPWEAYVNEQIYHQNEDLISVGVTTEIFSGGAHGYKILSFVNLSPVTGNLLSTEDLFKKGFESYAQQRFREEQNIPSGANINSTGFWFEDDTFDLPENMGFTPEHIILVYNSYEIAPYAAGDIIMKIPLEEVRSYLKIE